MRFPVPAAFAAFALVGLGEFTQAVAQPVPPIVRRPVFGGTGLFTPGAYGGYGAGGFNALGLSNPALANQFAMNQMAAQNLAIQQNFAVVQGNIYQAINPNLPMTGRGAVFNNLGHWYSGGRGGVGGGFGGVGPGPGGIGAGGIGLGVGLGGGGFGGREAPARDAGGGAAGGAPARTSGNGFPVRR